jgi:hypothetical protein
MHISSFFIPSSDLLYRFLVSISVAASVIEGSLPKQLEFGQCKPFCDLRKEIKFVRIYTYFLSNESFLQERCNTP